VCEEGRGCVWATVRSQRRSQEWAIGQQLSWGRRQEEQGQQDTMWRAESRPWEKGKGVGEVNRIWENTG